MKIYKLRDIGSLIRRNIKIQDDKEYRQLTIKMNNEGICFREEKLGFEIGVKNQSEVHTNDLVFSRIDIRNGAIGFVPEELDGAVVGNDFPVFQLKNNINHKYLDWCFKTKDFREQSIALSAGATNRKKMKRDNFLNLQIPLPNENIQTEIVQKIAELNLKVESIKQFCTKLNDDIVNLRNIMLNRIFEGKIKFLLD